MYDFYKNPPQSKADLREWLTDWLQKPEKETIIQVNNEVFSLEFGFVRAGYSHEVFQSKDTGEYIWWVTENCNEIDSTKFPSQRFPSYDALLDSVINSYYRSWKLTA
jgi:hypothetical protein